MSYEDDTDDTAWVRANAGRVVSLLLMGMVLGGSVTFLWAR